MGTPIACTECHGAASATYTNSHTDGVVQVAFGTRANQGTTTVWTRASGTCASNYCHGGTTAVAGGTGTTPVWTTVNGTFKACASCHGNPPALNATTHHPANPSCATCHGAGYTSTTVAAATHVNGTVNLSRTGCTLCHGDLAQTGVAATSAASAPGFNATSADSTGATAATVAGVGAHAAHLVGTRWRGTALACNECHTVPAAADVAHATGTGTGGARATVIFGTLARTGGITTATYAGSTTAANGTAAGTCSNTYCHGNFAGSGATGAISWTGGVAAASCGTCHGSPPPAPHVQNSACGSCHTGYTSTTVNAAAHINGVVDVTTMTCTSCHGAAGVNSAPPVSTTGGSATTLVSVGAHQAHVASTLRPAIACTECHGAASATYTTTHADGTVQTSFGTLSNQGTTTVWTRASGTCASNYCHGGTTAVAGGTGTTPVWTTVNGTFRACASCHGNPPALNATTHHPANPSCATCHGAGYTSTTVAAATHVNGTVNLSRTGCTLCHGDLAQTGVAATSAASAPGFNATSADSTGATAATVAGVGAHAAHLVGTRWRGTALACNECHTVPAAADVAHATGTGTGGARATVIFGTLARTGGITTATYAGSTTAANGTAAGTCSNTYCHGNFAGSGATGAISWTGGVAAASCGTCHGSPPPAPHVQNSACGSCHTGYTATTVSATAHLNGVVNVTTMTCTSCHGDTLRTGTDPNIAAMPPVGTAGETLTTQPAVGAHLAHLTAGALARAFACTDCHNPPLSTNHATGTTTFSWSVLAGGGAVTYNFTNQTCSSTYCHGNFAGGNAANAPSWIAGTATVACGSCHGTPGVTGAPPLPHSQNAACGNCHVGYTATTVNTTNHVNGIVDVVAQTCTTCHGTAGVNSAPPVNTTGGSATTLVSVGAHQAHVASTLRPAIACTECHGAASATYTTTHADGTVQTSFGTLSNQGTTTVWTRASGTCASNYCHGGTTAVAGGTGTTPVWTTVNGTFRACASCHGNPPALNATTHHPANPSCATCHGAGYTSTTVAAATHVNGTVNLSRTGCTLCHGDLAQTGVAATSAASAPGFNATSADSTGATAATVAGVGAHAAHLVGTRWRGTALACNECHTVPAAADVAHATGTGTGGARATVIFGTLARTGGITTATYAGSTTAANGTAAGTCSNTYCHGNFAGSGATGAISWTGGVAAASCGTCHGSPPGPTSATLHHPQNANCVACHPGYSTTTVNATTHVNGVVNKPTGCTACHGDLTATGVANTDVRAAPAANANATDTRGSASTATNVRGIGAHARHLTGTAWRSTPMACSECHTVPASGDETHVTAIVQRHLRHRRDGHRQDGLGRQARHHAGLERRRWGSDAHLLQHLLPRQLPRRPEPHAHLGDPLGGGLRRLPRHPAAAPVRRRHRPQQQHRLRHLPRRRLLQHRRRQDPPHERQDRRRRRVGRRHELRRLPRHLLQRDDRRPVGQGLEARPGRRRSAGRRLQLDGDRPRLFRALSPTAPA